MDRGVDTTATRRPTWIDIPFAPISTLSRGLKCATDPLRRSQTWRGLVVGRSAVPASMLQRSRPSTPSRGATTTGRSAAAHTWARTAEGWSKSDRKAQPQSTECGIWPATGIGGHDHGASRTRRTMRCRADTIAQQHNNRNNEEYSTEPLRSLWLECRTIESNLSVP